MKLWLKSRNFNRCNRNNDCGNSPVKPLPWRLRLTRNERFPSCGEIVPLSPILLRFKVWTLPWCSSHVTPTQVHKEEDVDQLWTIGFLGSKVMEDLKARSDDSSVVMFFLLLADEVKKRKFSESERKKRREHSLAIFYARMKSSVWVLMKMNNYIFISKITQQLKNRSIYIYHSIFLLRLQSHSHSWKVGQMCWRSHTYNAINCLTCLSTWYLMSFLCVWHRWPP